MAARHCRRMGFAGMLTYYAPYVEVVNAAFIPSASEVAHAQEIVAAYEGALRDGAAAARLGNTAILAQDYKRALRLLGEPDQPR